jgi:circadian clock protein KaiC
MNDDLKKIPTGIEGLDDVLHGGLPPDRVYLVEGDPGTGKTTLGLQFLRATCGQEQCLYITLSETEEELRSAASSHDWSLDGLAIEEISTQEPEDEQQTFFPPSEVELNETIRRIRDAIERLEPSRVVIDSFSEMRMMAGEPHSYRRQLYALKRLFRGRNCTALFLDDRLSQAKNLHLQSLTTGVITLEQMAPHYGPDRRRLRVAKVRGSTYSSGYHDFRIETGGIVVFPRRGAAEFHKDFVSRAAPSGVPELDTLLGGGLDHGTSTLFMGAAGVGKSALASQYAVTAAAGNESSVIYIFDETRRTFLRRSAALGMDLGRHVDAGRILLEQADASKLSMGEFAHTIQKTVQERGLRIVVIDSLNGLLNASSEERLLDLQLHELLASLAEQGVVTILVLALHGLVGAAVGPPLEISYLADTVILLRYFEHGGAVRQAISVLKKRSGGHERTIREFMIAGRSGIRIGGPLTDFQGVLTGVPQYLGSAKPLMKAGDASPRSPNLH